MRSNTPFHVLPLEITNLFRHARSSLTVMDVSISPEKSKFRSSALRSYSKMLSFLPLLPSIWDSKKILDYNFTFSSRSKPNMIAYWLYCFYYFLLIPFFISSLGLILAGAKSNFLSNCLFFGYSSQLTVLSVKFLSFLGWLSAFISFSFWSWSM